MAGITGTKDYSKFKIIEGNRSINSTHLSNLTMSILKKNMLNQNPIICNEKFEIVDGQHRFEVARNNKLEIFYLILEGAHIDEVVQLNSTNRMWHAMDYIDSYVTRGFKPYIWLKEFLADYKLSIENVNQFMYSNDNDSTRLRVKRGLFNPTEEQKERAMKRADIYWDIKPYIKNRGRLPHGFMKALIDTMDAGYGKKLVENIQKRGIPFYAEYSFKDAKIQVESLLK